jgi:hypothetical protein
MRSDKLEKSNWGVEQHPSTETLRQYEEGILSSALSHELERHLMDCELCDDILTGMALADRNHTQQAKNKILQRIQTRLRKNRRRSRALLGLGDWRVATAVLMMFVSLGLLLFYHYTRSVADQKDAVRPGEILPPTPEELLARTIDSALVLDIPAPPPAPVHRLAAAPTTAEQHLNGRVLTDQGQSIANALVKVQGTDLSWKTNANGNFSLILPAEGLTILISAEGYSPKEIRAIGLKTPLIIRLEAKPTLR